MNSTSSKESDCKLSSLSMNGAAAEVLGNFSRLEDYVTCLGRRLAREEDKAATAMRERDEAKSELSMYKDLLYKERRIGDNARRNLGELKILYDQYFDEFEIKIQIQKDEMSMQALNFTRIRAQEKKRADYKIEKLRTAALETENDVQKIQARRLVLENYLRNEVGERKIETTGKSMSLMELLQILLKQLDYANLLWADFSEDLFADSSWDQPKQRSDNSDHSLGVIHE